MKGGQSVFDVISFNNSLVLSCAMLLRSPCLETSCQTRHAKWPHVFDKNGNKLVIYVRKIRTLEHKWVLLGCSDMELDIIWEDYTLIMFQENYMEKRS